MAKLPKLITHHGISGYDADELDAALGERYMKWARGQTVMDYDKEDGTKGYLVYKWDVDNYLAGMPQLD